jgi:acyl-CoA thioesterase YciA
MASPAPAQPGQNPDAPPGERRLALRVVTMPRDTNQYGTIFGGVILSYIDQAGFVEARRHGTHRWVTVALDRVEFTRPVHLGDVVNFWARTVRQGTKSVTVEVEVEAERYTTGACDPVTTATITLVSVDAEGRPIPFSAPATTE